MKNPWILPAAALALGAAGGFLTGKNASSSDASMAGEATAPQRVSARSAASAEGTSDPARRNGATRSRSLDEILRMPGQSGRIQALMEYYAGLSPEQLEEEARKLENLPMGERMMASFLLFGRWAEEDPLAAMAYSDTMGFAGAFIRPTILQSWASVDPQNAARYYQENAAQFAMMGGRGPMGQGSAGSIAGEWARQDPEAALAWAGTLEGRERSQALASVVREVATNDPAKAAQLASTMDADSRGDAYETIARQWGSKNFTEAEAWIRTLPADQQDAAMASALAGLSLDNPQLATQKVQTMRPGESKDEAVATLAGNWARQDPAAAATWLMQQNSPDAQSRAMRDLIPTWAAQNDQAALGFVTSQPAGQVRDSAAQAYVWSNRSSNPDAVVRVAESITDDGDRTRSVAMAASRWMQQDAQAATAYIQSSTAIPDRMKNRLIEGRGFGGDWGGRRGRNR